MRGCNYLYWIPVTVHTSNRKNWCFSWKGIMAIQTTYGGVGVIIMQSTLGKVRIMRFKQFHP